jgi:hypothetical protein
MTPNLQYINRKIFFYKIYAGKNAAGVPLNYDLKCVLKHINSLSFQTSERYLLDLDETEICCWIDDLLPPQRARFYKINRTLFPQVEYRGSLTPLSIPKEHGLAECAHVVFFPENIVGIEYNYRGPRASNISAYLYDKSRAECPQIPLFEQLLQRDAIKKLEHIGGIRKFRLRVHESFSNSIEQANESLGQAFKSAKELGQAKELELTLSTGKWSNKKETLGSNILDTVKKLLSLDNAYTDMISGEIRGRNEISGQLETIDLLSDKLVAEKRIPRMENNDNDTLIDDFVYNAISEAYTELEAQLHEAVGVTVWPEQKK